MAILEAATRAIARHGVRGMRVEDIAADAGVSVALIYYHFADRAGLLRRTLEFISDRANRYTTVSLAADPFDKVSDMLLLELQDVPAVRENSTAWGELRASAIFAPELREQLRAATQTWVDEIADVVGQAGVAADPVEAAERLTSLVEGLSERWLSGSMTLERARHLLRGAISAEFRGAVGAEPGGA